MISFAVHPAHDSDIFRKRFALPRIDATPNLRRVGDARRPNADRTCIFADAFGISSNVTFAASRPFPPFFEIADWSEVRRIE